jgi:hypothetical protein
MFQLVWYATTCARGTAGAAADAWTAVVKAADDAMYRAKPTAAIASWRTFPDRRQSRPDARVATHVAPTTSEPWLAAR